MLRLRIITSLIILPLTVWLALAASTPVFMSISMVALLLAAYEWSNLIGLTKLWSKLLLILLLLFSMLLSLHMTPVTVFAIALLWWLLALVWIALYPFGVFAWNRLFILGILSIEVFMPCWLALVTLRIKFGSAMLLYFLGLIWAADIGAYFVGRIIGKHKLAPKVSPGKTIEGVLGGVLFAQLVAVAGAIYFKLSASSLVLWFGLALLTTLVSVVGDLLESMLKRNRGVKDSGHLLPGHGGLLDRIDSLTSAAPFFALGLILFRHVLF